MLLELLEIAYILNKEPAGVVRNAALPHKPIQIAQVQGTAQASAGGNGESPKGGIDETLSGTAPHKQEYTTEKELADLPTETSMAKGRLNLLLAANYAKEENYEKAVRIRDETYKGLIEGAKRYGKNEDPILRHQLTAARDSLDLTLDAWYQLMPGKSKKGLLIVRNPHNNEETASEQNLELYDAVNGWLSKQEGKVSSPRLVYGENCISFDDVEGLYTSRNGENFPEAASTPKPEDCTKLTIFENVYVLFINNDTKGVNLELEHMSGFRAGGAKGETVDEVMNRIFNESWHHLVEY